MIQTIDLTGRTRTTAELLAAVPRATAAAAEASEAAARIIDEVRQGGEAALRAQAAAFDHVEGHALRVPQAHIDEAVAALDPRVRAALEAAIERVREASTAQVPPATVTEFGPGARVVQRWQPVRRVGVYVPGGKAVYPSSVVMNVVPAQIAGVASVVVASPPQRDFDGEVHPV
ncbi:MAG: histidinol dehydrogenase, partial [Microthrixaceae bacterium]|nr:histidinol dehydrogenase [Microthrixaceae bacterium]